MWDIWIIGVCALLLAIVFYEAIVELLKPIDEDGNEIYEPFFDLDGEIQGFRKVKR